MIQRNGKIDHVLRLEALILWKWPYYPKQSTELRCPYQITHDIFHRTRTNNHKICLEPQKIHNGQRNPEEKEQSWRHKPPRLQTYRKQKSMILAQKQTHGSTEWNRKSINKTTHPQSINFWQWRQEYTIE